MTFQIKDLISKKEYGDLTYKHGAKKKKAPKKKTSNKEAKTKKTPK